MSIVNSQFSITRAKQLVIIGAGGLGREVLQYIKDINKVKFEYDILGFIDENKELGGTIVNGVPVLGDFEKTPSDKGQIYAVCAVANPKFKKKLVEIGYEKGLEYINVIHPLAYIAENINIGKGIIIGPYSVISVNTDIGDHVVINPQCGIGHDVKIGSYSTLYWNVSLAGFTYIEEGVEVGSKVFIKQNITIGYKSIVGAGAVVTRNVKPKSTVMGVPAREIINN